MKKVILVILFVSLVAFLLYYLYGKKVKKTNDETKTKLEPVLPVTADAPKPEQQNVMMSPFEGAGKFAVDQTIFKMEQNRGEIENVLMSAGLTQDSIYNGTNPELWKNRIQGNGVILPLYIGTEKTEILQRGKNITFQSGIWQNVSNIRSVSMDFEAKTGASFLTAEAQKDSNKFVDQYPCLLSGCPSNDKNRNENVMKNGSMKQVTEEFKKLCSNYLDATGAAKTAVRNEAIKKLVNSGWKFPGY